MCMKKLVCLVLLLSFLPLAGFAASYNGVDIYDGKIEYDDIVFKAGDTINGGRGITITIDYEDASGEKLEDGNSKIKSLVVDGRKCSEWKMTGYSASVIKINDKVVRGAIGFSMQPVYAVEDKEGYYLLSAATYKGYTEETESMSERKVKFTGQVVDTLQGELTITLGEEMPVAIIYAQESMGKGIVAGDRVMGRGDIAEYIVYGEKKIPTVLVSELEKQQYEELKKDDKGENVLKMKQRLQNLGYFNATAELSDVYNDVCVARVKQFQKKNGLAETGSADANTLSLLYSDTAKSK